jgi:hypothetical protein
MRNGRANFGASGGSRAGGALRLGSGQKRRFLSAVYEVMSAASAAGDLQPSKSTVAVCHEYRHLLLWPTARTAMLSPHARTSVYHIVRLQKVACGAFCPPPKGATFGGYRLPGVLGRCYGSDCVQVGGRQRCGPLQRSASRERPEGRVEGTADLSGSQDSSHSGGTFLQGDTTEGGSGLSELWNLRANRGPGVHEHRYGNGRRDFSTSGSARRYRHSDTGWPERPRGTGKRRSVHDFARGSGYSLDSDDDQGSKRRHRLQHTSSDLPRAAAVTPVTDPARQATLVGLAEIAPGNFRGHYFVDRGQKARFLAATPLEGACGVQAAISANMTSPCHRGRRGR